VRAARVDQIAQAEWFAQAAPVDLSTVVLPFVRQQPPSTQARRKGSSFLWLLRIFGKTTKVSCLATQAQCQAFEHDRECRPLTGPKYRRQP